MIVDLTHPPRTYSPHQEQNPAHYQECSVDFGGMLNLVHPMIKAHGNALLSDLARDGHGSLLFPLMDLMSWRSEVAAI
jgi:hypothetical protein